MRVLLACEESQAVCKEFRKKGHEAYSADIQDCSGGHPEWHIKRNVFEILNGGWDIMIGFPPCTDLAVSGARWFPEKIADGRQQMSIDFFMRLINSPIEKIAIENPIGIMSTKYRKPDQIIQPYFFGDTERKSTCLWLKGLPKLIPTDIVTPKFIIGKDGKKYSKIHYLSKGSSKKYFGCERSVIRSKTFPGIAKAMAEQWG